MRAVIGAVRGSKRRELSGGFTETRRSPASLTVKRSCRAAEPRPADRRRSRCCTDQNRPGLMASEFHRDQFRHRGPYQIAHRGAAEVVRDAARAASVGAGFSPRLVEAAFGDPLAGLLAGRVAEDVTDSYCAPKICAAFLTSRGATQHSAPYRPSAQMASMAVMLIFASASADDIRDRADAVIALNQERSLRADHLPLVRLRDALERRRVGRDEIHLRAPAFRES